METKSKAQTGELPSIYHITDDMAMTDGNGEATRKNEK